MKPIIQVVLFISSTQHRERNCYFTVFFITRCQCGNCQSKWREKTSSAGKQMGSKIKIWRMLQWNSCRQKPDVLSNTQVLRKLVKADLVCIFFFWFCFWFFFVTKHHYVHSACLVFVFFILHPVVFSPYCRCQRGQEWFSFG